MHGIAFAAIAVAVPNASFANDATGENSDKTDDRNTIVVEGLPIEDYSASDTLSATRYPIALKELPLSVSIVPQELIEDRGILNLTEALDSVAGAQRRQGYGGTQNFGAFIRGFDAGTVTFRNGQRDFGFYTLRDIANVERFEILKGPASLLYGAVQPGGVTNTITKQPTAAATGRVRAIVGSFDRYRGEVDLGGPITEGLGYRLNGSYENYGSYRDKVESESYFIAPVVSFASGGTRVTVEGEYKATDFVWDLGLPRNPLSFTVPISRFLGEPDARNDVESLYGSIKIEQQLGDNWRARAITSLSRTEGDYNLRSPLSIAANGRTVNRVAYRTDEFSRSNTLQADLAGAFTTGALEHKLSVGVDYYRVVTAYDFFFQPIASIDLLAPVYGAQPGPGFRLFANRLTTDATGFFIQDVISIADRVHILAGVRYESINNRNVDLTTGLLLRDVTDDAWTPQAGVLVDISDTTGIYASYGKSFLPVTSGRTTTGDFLDPENGEQFEIGLKQQLLGGDAQMTLAAYQITKQNVSTPDPANAAFRVQTGEQRSRGIELEMSGQVAAGWDMFLTASYIDAEVTKDNRFAVGSALPGAPKWSASLWSKYSFAGALEGLSIGGGAYFVDKRQASLPNNIWTIPDYLRFDAMAAYDFGPVTLQLNLRNLTNRKIYDLTGTTLLPQEPRAFSLRATFGF